MFHRNVEIFCMWDWEKNILRLRFYGFEIQLQSEDSNEDFIHPFLQAGGNQKFDAVYAAREGFIVNKFGILNRRRSIVHGIDADFNGRLRFVLRRYDLAFCHTLAYY